jgi:glutamyl-tRNA synthetase
LGGDLVSLIGEAKDLLSELTKRIKAGDFDFSSAEQMKSQINKLGEDLNLKGKKLFMPIRAVLSARQHGPDLGLIMKLLGKETVLARMADFG